MERVSGLMEKLRPSEAEKKGIRIGWSDGKKIGEIEAQAGEAAVGEAGNC